MGPSMLPHGSGHTPLPGTPPSRAESTHYEARLFGPFRVQRAGEALSDTDFRRSAAKTLLKWFLLNPATRVRGSEICELLWPSRTPMSSARLLHVTLHYLRHVLEPHLASRQASTFIRTDGANRHWFDDADSWWVDVRDSERLVSEAQAAELRADHRLATERYEAALAYHEQVFLPEDVYDDAFMSWRTAQEVAAEQVRSRLLRLYLTQRLAHKALTLGLSMLAHDAACEQGLTAMVEVYLGQGNPLAARRMLDDYLRALREEGGGEPSPEVMRLWRRSEQAP